MPHHGGARMRDLYDAKGQLRRGEEQRHNSFRFLSMQ
jgi:hypothetical protein